MPKQILLVEDSITVQRMVEITFAREDYAITAVKSADEALSRAKSARPDVVLVDAGLSGKNGYDLCAMLRGEADLSTVPCLLLTGNASPYDEVKGGKVGADGFVVKPFETQALIDKVAQALSIKRTPSASMPAVAPAASAPSLTPIPAPLPKPPVSAPPNAPTMTAPAPNATLAGLGAAPPPAPMPPSVSKSIPIAMPPAAPPPSQPKMPAVDMSPAASSGSIPAQAPQMPRPSLIPHTPTPSPLGGSGAQARPAPRATLMGIPTVPAGGPMPTGSMPAVQTQPLPTAPPPAAPKMPAAAPAMMTPMGRIDTEPLVTSVAQQAHAQMPAGSDAQAVAAMSREIIERIAWEVVPELAETIIREQLDRLVRERQGG